MKLLLVRHGEIPSNVMNIYAGRSSEGLTERGLRQAEEVAERLKHIKIHSLYSSPINRALQTAGIISKSIGIDYIVDDSFQELIMGPWEGLSEEEVARQYPEEWQIWLENPAELRLSGRETLEELFNRVLKGIVGIYYKNSDKNVIVVTHVAIIRVMLLWHENKSLNLYKTVHVPNAEIFEMNIEDIC